jgi:hypothetical protein
MSPSSSPLAGLVARLTDPHDRETYAGLLSYFDSLPPDDEMFRLARLLGLLTLVGQRIPEAAAELTIELHTQTKAASACYELLNERLSRIAIEITDGVDASAIARAMAESVRQAAGLELGGVRKLADEVAEDLRMLSRTVRAATAATIAERARLIQDALNLKAAADAVTKASREKETIIAWLLFLSGLLAGFLALASYVQCAR